MSRLRRFFDGNGKSPPKDAFQYRGWIYAYVFTTVCVSRYIFTTNRRSFANFIECELELLKRVFLPVINLSFLGLICDEFDGKRVPVSRSFVSHSFLASISKEYRHRMKDGHSYIFEIWKTLAWYCTVSQTILLFVTERIPWLTFTIFISLIPVFSRFKIFIRHRKPSRTTKKRQSIFIIFLPSSDSFECATHPWTMFFLSMFLCSVLNFV